MFSGVSKRFSATPETNFGVQKMFSGAPKMNFGVPKTVSARPKMNFGVPKHISAFRKAFPPRRKIFPLVRSSFPEHRNSFSPSEKHFRWAGKHLRRVFRNSRKTLLWIWQSLIIYEHLTAWIDFCFKIWSFYAEIHLWIDLFITFDLHPWILRAGKNSARFAACL